MSDITYFVKSSFDTDLIKYFRIMKQSLFNAYERDAMFTRYQREAYLINDYEAAEIYAMDIDEAVKDVDMYRAYMAEIYTEAIARGIGDQLEG